MNLTNQEIKLLYQYQLCASLFNEYFKYAEPVLLKIQSEKYQNRQQRREGIKEYLKDIKIHKRWVLGTANIIEKRNNDEVEIFIDKVSELLDQVEINVVD